MLLLNLCGLLYLTGAVLSARALCRNEIKKFGRINIVIIVICAIACLITPELYKSSDILFFIIMQVYGMAFYPLVLAIVALVTGIVKKLEVTIGWAVVCIFLWLCGLMFVLYSR